MTAYSTRMPAGIAGTMSRMEQNTTEAGNLDQTNPPTLFGTVGILNAGRVRAVLSGDTITATNLAGLIARPYPASANVLSSSVGNAIPATWMAADVMKRGYMQVQLGAGDYTAGTITKGNQVYVRVTAATGPTRPVGNITDQATGAVAIPGCYFQGPPDGFGNTEVAFNI